MVINEIRRELKEIFESAVEDGDPARRVGVTFNTKTNNILLMIVSGNSQSSVTLMKYEPSIDKIRPVAQNDGELKDGVSLESSLSSWAESDSQGNGCSETIILDIGFTSDDITDLKEKVKKRIREEKDLS